MAWEVKKRSPSSPIPKPRQGFTLDEDESLKIAKEWTTMSWEDMSKNFAGRSAGTLKQRFRGLNQAREEPRKSAPRRRRKAGSASLGARYARPRDGLSAILRKSMAVCALTPLSSLLTNMISEAQVFCCTQCGKEYSVERSLDRHIREAHKVRSIFCKNAVPGRSTVSRVIRASKPICTGITLQLGRWDTRRLQQ